MAIDPPIEWPVMRTRARAVLGDVGFDRLFHAPIHCLRSRVRAAMNLHAERGILKRDGLKRQIGLPTGKVRRTFDDHPQRRGVVLRGDAKVDRQLRVLASVKTDSIRFDLPLLFDQSLLHFALQLGEFALHLPFLQFPFVLLCDRIRLVQLLQRLGGETLR